MTSKTPPVVAQKPKRTEQARRLAARDVERLAHEQALTHFETNRASVWAALWAAATRLKLCLAEDDGAATENDWWFDEFKVNAREQTFVCLSSNHKNISEASLTFDLAEKISSDLARGQNMFDEFVDAKERQRREAEDLATRKNEALARIPEADRKLLGLPNQFYPSH